MIEIAAAPTFRLGYVAGVIPTKWVRIWRQRIPGVYLELVPIEATCAADDLRSPDPGAQLDAALVRLPLADGEPVLNVITLYAETPVAVVPVDHFLCAGDEVSAADLAGEVVHHPLDDAICWGEPLGAPAATRPGTTEDAIKLVAAGVGVLVVPQSLARLHHRKDLTYRPITDLPAAEVGLAWPQEATTDLVEELIGIVRGRTVNSTRGPARAVEAAPKLTASQKAAARKARRAELDGTSAPTKGSPRRPRGGSGARKRR